MEVTFTGTPHEIMQQYEHWLKTLDPEQTLLYNRIIITGNKADKVALSEYKKAIQEIAIANGGGIKSIDNEIMQCYNVEKKRFSNGFYITGIKIK
ncbi:gamma-glutamyl kinase [Enterococcus phage IME-EFm5]|uniref:Gamma-glutamyl kinase n=1 Tax=Enterococcus phage IME-EFm5 TaxID=1718158 RepID=A0A0M4RT99_9CAUD|nr:gamma-glutamyl kinase [Enterococcus phage IME-EFm5]ALF02030.1 gamma-glutamyl kinase [Enterococcus phage IME-EFm5]